MIIFLQQLETPQMTMLDQIEAKNSFIELCGFLAQANHAPKKVARFKASAAALLGRHCRKKVRNCVKTLEITASFFKVCNLTQQLSPPKSSARDHSQNNSNKFTFSHFLFYYVESTGFFSCKLYILIEIDKKIKKIINPLQKKIMFNSKLEN